MRKTFLALPLLLLIGAGCASTAVPPPAAPTGQPSAQGQAAPASAKFADQPYYQYSYLISGDTLTPDAQSALSGFQMTKTQQPDGVTDITLKAVKSGYRDQQYVLKPGEQLYFIERFLQDDDPVKNEDKNMKDDQGVVVDAQGNVVQGPADWTVAP